MHYNNPPPFILNTFDDVARLYASVEPCVSKKRPREADVRPYGKRKYPQCRVARFDENTYGILFPACPDNTTGWWSTHMPEEIVERYCPVMWRRTAEGDFIHIRSSVYRMNPTWYSSLHHVTPVSMSFPISNHVGFRRMCVTGLPDFVLKDGFQVTTSSFLSGPTNPVTIMPEEIVLKCEPDGTFVHVRGGTKGTLRNRVDFEKKAQVATLFDAILHMCWIKHSMLCRFDDLRAVPLWRFRKLSPSDAQTDSFMVDLTDALLYAHAWSYAPGKELGAGEYIIHSWDIAKPRIVQSLQKAFALKRTVIVED